MKARDVVNTGKTAPGGALGLQAGEIVEVRGREEILATLDRTGRLDKMPFMPEMLQYCGRRLRVYKRAHKTCDNIRAWSLRRVKNAVHLEGVRCDGADHGGCQAGCLIFWNEAWLKRADQPVESAGAARGTQDACSVDDLMQATRKQPEKPGDEPVYSCQATDLLEFTSNLPWWDVRQYIADVTSRNLATGLENNTRSDRILETILSIVQVLRASIIWAFNGVQCRRHSTQYPSIEGSADQTPVGNRLDLQPGELVQIRSKEEIVATLNSGNRNRGLLFEGEMLPFCGGFYRVARRVDHIVNEKTGKMLHMKNPCIVLEGAFCRGDNHLHCPRAIVSYWRESWLRRAAEGAADERAAGACGTVSADDTAARNGGQLSVEN
jgi:hypothetical protein